MQSVICLIECNNKILLARNTYGNREWIFPGGGIKRGESKEIAAHRETFEEVGINLDSLVYFGEYTQTEFNKNAIVHCFYSKINNFSIKIDEIEIGEADWFEWSNLPDNLSLDTVKIIKFYKTQPVIETI